MRSFDYVIVGSGIAGLYAALLAREHGSVLVLTKGGIDECNTKYAQGGIAAAVGPDDSADLHLADTLGAGAGLVDEGAARILAAEAADRILTLLESLGFQLWAGELGLKNAAGKAVVLEGLEEFREHLGGNLTITLLKAIGQGFEVHEMDEARVAEAIERLAQRQLNPA